MVSGWHCKYWVHEKDTLGLFQSCRETIHFITSFPFNWRLINFCQVALGLSKFGCSNQVDNLRQELDMGELHLYWFCWACQWASMPSLEGCKTGAFLDWLKFKTQIQTDRNNLWMLTPLLEAGWDRAWLLSHNLLLLHAHPLGHPSPTQVSVDRIAFWVVLHLRCKLWN